MIFVKNKTDQTLSRLGVALGANNYPTKQKTEKQEQKTISDINNVFQEENEEPSVIKINKKKEIDKPKEKDNQLHEKFIHSGNNIFSLNKKQLSENKKNKKNYVLKLKNNMLFPLNVPGCTPYDPYLINVCKNAIINVKDELPYYKEIINKINTEFGIEEGNNLIELNSNNFGFNTFNSFKSFTKTKTNYTKDKNNNNTPMKTFSSFNKETENTNNINNINYINNINNTNNMKELRRGSKKK